MTQAGLIAEAAVIASVCGAGLLALWWVKRQPSRSAPGAFQKPPEGAVRAMGDLLAELKRTSDSMASSLDRRAADLRALIAEADRRVSALETLRGEAPPPSIPPLAPAEDRSPDLQAAFEQVYALADAGKPLTEISRETQLNKGSVQLILGLRGMRKGADGGSGPPGPSRG